MCHALAAVLAAAMLLPPAAARADLLTPRTILETWADATDAGDDDVVLVDPGDDADVLLTVRLAELRIAARVGGRRARLVGRVVVTGGRLADAFGGPGTTLAANGVAGRFVNHARGVRGVRTTDPGGDLFAEAGLLTPDAPLTAAIRKLVARGRRGRMVLAAARSGDGLRVFGSGDPTRPVVRLELRAARLFVDGGPAVPAVARGAWAGLAVHGVTRFR